MKKEIAEKERGRGREGEGIEVTRQSFGESSRSDLGNRLKPKKVP